VLHTDLDEAYRRGVTQIIPLRRRLVNRHRQIFDGTVSL